MEKLKNDQHKKNENANFSKINDWSMHFDSMNCSLNTTEGRPSVVVQQSFDNDVVSIVKNAESRTWDALGFMRKQLNEQSNKLDSLLVQSTHETCTGASKALDLCNYLKIASPLPSNALKHSC